MYAPSSLALGARDGAVISGFLYCSGRVVTRTYCLDEAAPVAFLAVASVQNAERSAPIPIMERIGINRG